MRRKLTQNEVLKVLELIGMKISLQKFGKRKNNGSIPKEDISATRPFPVWYYRSTVYKIVEVLSKSPRYKVEISKGQVDTAIEQVLSENSNKYASLLRW